MCSEIGCDHQVKVSDIPLCIEAFSVAKEVRMAALSWGILT